MSTIAVKSNFEVEIVIKLLEEVEKLKSMRNEHVQELHSLENHMETYRSKKKLYELLGKVAHELNVHLDSVASHANSTQRVKAIKKEIDSFDLRIEQLSEYVKEINEQAPDLLDSAQYHKRITQFISEFYPDDEMTDVFEIQGFISKTSWDKLYRPYVLIDGFNAIGSIARYDYKHLNAELGQCRDMLIRDISWLGCQLGGEWHIVYDTVHNYDRVKIPMFDNVFVDYQPGNRVTRKNFSDEWLIKMIMDALGQVDVIVVTNDLDLLQRVNSMEVQTIFVSDLYR